MTQEDLFQISGGVSGPGSPLSYNTAHVSNLISGSSFNSTINFTSCEKTGCSIKLPSSFYCPQSTVINVTISAADKQGVGSQFIVGKNPYPIAILVQD